MRLTKQQIRHLVDNPEQASSGEEHRLLKLMSGEGKACTDQEKKAESYARQYKQRPWVEETKAEGQVNSSFRGSSGDSTDPDALSTGTVEPTPNDKLCIDCSDVIPAQRAAIEGIVRCVVCQSRLEKSNPGSVERRMNEGIAGTREDNRRVRRYSFRDLRRRNYE